MRREFEILNRRGFFGVAAKTAAIVGLTPFAVKALPASEANPFAYDVSRFEKTDPKLISHEISERWICNRKDARNIAFGPDEQAYICAGNYLTAYGKTGNPGLEIALPERVCCVAVSGDGTIYAGTRASVHLFDPKGKRLAVWNSPHPKSWFTGISVGTRGIFVADSGRRVVLRFNQDGTLAGHFGGKNTERKSPGLAIPSPYLDVILNRDGLLNVNNTGRHQVETYSLDGEFMGAWGKCSSAIDGFCGCCNPIGIATLPDGRFVTAEKGLPRVKIYSAAGDFKSVVAGMESFPENAKACSSLNDCVHGGLAVAADSRGRIYILDFVTNEVRVMQHKARPGVESRI